MNAHNKALSGNPSHIVSANKESAGNALGAGLGVMESDSAQNLISKAQVHEVMKGINGREGLFSEEDLKNLEGGYSVSETEDENASALNDILSANSVNRHLMGAGSALGGDMFSPNIGASPGLGTHWDENADVPMDPNFRQQQLSGALMGELASQKSKFSKKMVQLERQNDKL